MPGFKSSKQRGFLFAMDKDKQKGVNPIAAKSAAQTMSTSQPSQITPAPKSFSLGMSSNPQPFHPPVSNVISPTAVPSLPGMQKMPKFGRVKKFFKK